MNFCMLVILVYLLIGSFLFVSWKSHFQTQICMCNISMFVLEVDLGVHGLLLEGCIGSSELGEILKLNPQSQANWN